MRKNKKKIFQIVSAAVAFGFIIFFASVVQTRAQSAEQGIADLNPSGQSGQPSTASSGVSLWESIKNNVLFGTGSAEQGNYELQKPLIDQIQQPSSGTSTYVNQEKIPGAPQQTGNFVDYIKQIIRFGFAAIGIVALFMLSVGAYQYLMAASNLAKIENAKGTISSALFGLVLGLTAFLILRTINPQFVNLQLVSPGGVGGTLPGTTGAIPKFSGAAPEEIKKKVQEYAGKYGIDEDLGLRLVNAESNFNPNATSSKGAQGLMQLMPGTASGLGVNNSYDIDQNLNGGMRYFKSLLDKYGGNAEIALAAYNWGPDKVDKNGIDNLPKETRDFLCEILRKC